MPEENKSNKAVWIAVIIALALAVICCCLVALIAGGNIFNDSGDQSQGNTDLDNMVSTTPTAEIPPVLEETENDQTWLVMLYQDADDALLEEDIVFDLNEAELVGSSDEVTIVSQLDRYSGPEGFSGDGDWHTAKRFYITRDDDLNAIRSVEIADLGEINMGAPGTLLDFVTWAVETYPADHYALILSDHGGGWTGGWTDSDPSYDYLSMNDLDYILYTLVSSLPFEKFDLIGFDACLMSQLDVYNIIAPYAHYAVASEEVEPATGWAYRAFLQQLVDYPDMDGRELASVIVETYLEQDERILNDEARARMLQGNTQITAQEVLDELLPYSTLTAVDLAYIPEITQALNGYAGHMTNINQKKVAAARNYTPSFQSVFGKGTVPSFIDLAQFSLILEQEVGDKIEPVHGERLREAITKSVILNKAGAEMTGAQGISIYFPNSELYTHPVGGYEVYTVENSRFVNNSLWDEFLAYHYAGVDFNPESKTAVIPSRMEDVSGPGAGQVQISELSLSLDTVTAEDTLSFTTEITGSNVGHVYLQYGWLASDVRTMLVVLGMDYIRSEQTREAGGAYYPDWGTSGEIEIDYEFKPSLFFIADEYEENITFVEVVASKYGATEDDVVITVPGIFTFGKSGRELYAEMEFNSTGEMIGLVGYSGSINIVEDESNLEGIFQIEYTGEEGAGSPYPITPFAGDTFMPFFIGYVIEDDVYVNVKSDPIAFGQTPFKLIAESVADFDLDFPYYVAVVVEDLDGLLTDAANFDTFEVQR